MSQGAGGGSLRLMDQEGGAAGDRGMGAAVGAGGPAQKPNGRPKTAKEERAQAVEQFGFDIYGSRSNASGKMGHLT